jgi:hypothetical protein
MVLHVKKGTSQRWYAMNGGALFADTANAEYFHIISSSEKQGKNTLL